MDHLVAAGESYQDPGPVFDCVVFHDGEAWRAVVDTDADGDLRSEKAMANFRLHQEWSTFGGRAQLNFGVNIFDDGKLLSIVVDSNPHGTHVAGIVAGHFPDQPELNGVAPGAQIVSVKIGDTRVQGMETAAGLERGVIAAVRNECDLINMSYGEPSRTPNRGKLPELMAKAVDENGIIFVSSAGNAGPALSTVGAPGATTSAILGVGAYVSPDMARAEYSIRGKITEGPYTFTSVGPTFDGDRGVDISAPGGAISPVPTWTLNRSQQMNGTSMASPNACGAIALMLSGAKAKGIEYSPYSVRKAIQNTARDVAKSEPLAEGPGLIQVPAAFEHLNRYHQSLGEQLFFDVRVGTERGIYLREKHEVLKAGLYSVSVTPQFSEATPNKTKLDFDLRFHLTASADWIEAGDSLVLNASGDRFRIAVDPTKLSPGVHYAELLGSAADQPARGPLFRVPITVVIPESVTAKGSNEATVEGGVRFKQGTIVRRFLAVPQGATWMDVNVQRVGGDGGRIILMHTLQALKGRHNRDTEEQHYLQLAGEEEAVHSIAVHGGRTLELCLTQYWWNLGETEIKYQVAFRGLDPDDRHLQLAANGSPQRVTVRSWLGDATLAPTATLATHRQSIFADEYKILPLGESRDRLPDGRLFHQLEATFSFEQKKAGKVMLRFPMTDGWLYDAAVGPHLWHLYDEHERLIHTDDIYPETGVSVPRLEKGKYTIRLQIRDTDRSTLESAKEMACYVERPLSSPIRLSFFETESDAQAGGRRFAKRRLKAGEQASVVVAAPDSGDLPSGFSAGDQLVGNISYGAADPIRPGPGRRPGGFPLVVVGTKGGTPKNALTPASPDEEDPKETAISKQQELADEMIELQVKQLEELGDDDQEWFDELAAQILDKRPNHLPVLLAQLKRHDRKSERDQRLHDIVSAADSVIAQVDQQELRQHLGTKVGEDPADKKRNKEMLEQRDVLTDALLRKCQALADLELADDDDSDAQGANTNSDELVVGGKQDVEPISGDDAADGGDKENSSEADAKEEALSEFEKALEQLKTWVDTDDDKYAKLERQRFERAGQTGLALKRLVQAAGDSWSEEQSKMRRDYYQELGWDHLHDNADDWIRRRKY